MASNLMTSTQDTQDTQNTQERYEAETGRLDALRERVQTLRADMRDLAEQLVDLADGAPAVTRATLQARYQALARELALLPDQAEVIARRVALAHLAALTEHRSALQAEAAHLVDDVDRLDEAITAAGRWIQDNGEVVDAAGIRFPHHYSFSPAKHREATRVFAQRDADRAERSDAERRIRLINERELPALDRHAFKLYRLSTNRVHVGDLGRQELWPAAAAAYAGGVREEFQDLTQLTGQPAQRAGA